MLPTDDAERGKYPMADGCLDYFPNALAEVSRISFEGNQKHNPGEPMHHARGKSTDHRNKVIRHTADSVTEDEPGIEHAAQAAWRALAYLQEKIERVRGAPMAPAARPAEYPIEAATMPELRKPTHIRLVSGHVSGCTVGRAYLIDGERDSDGDYPFRDDIGTWRLRGGNYNWFDGGKWELCNG